MTYEITYYFYNNVDEKPRETISLVQHENHSYVYHFNYDELTRKKTNEDLLKSFDKAHSFNAHVLFDNLVDMAKNNYKYSAMTTSQTYDITENK